MTKQAEVKVGEDHKVSEATKATAEKLKSDANDLLKAFHFSEAVELYSDAIAMYPTAVYYANRAMAHIKMESFGLAIIDATEAISLDPSYVKGYYRRGAANMALGHSKKALKDFKQVVKMKPNDRDARAKLKACEKAVKKEAFESAIRSERNIPLSETLDLNTIEVEPSYDGPHLSKEAPYITRDFIFSLLDRFKRQKFLHRKYVIQILLEMKKMLSSLPTLLYLDAPAEGEGGKPGAITVCGDTHGQFYDVCNIFEINGYPSNENPYLFNGDFVDRGSFSVEVILTLFAFKLLYPNGLHLTRGNHESKNMNKIYGFEGEVRHKYDETVMSLFTEVFNWLPLAAVLGKKVLVLHGGLFQDDNVLLDDIAAIDRNREPPESGLMSDLMWSDPQPFPGRGPSKRGIGLSFGPDITKKFLENNKLELLVRSHEVKDEGYLVEHNGKCITVFSAPNYCDQMGNKGAFIRFEKDMKPQFTQYEAVPHPPIKPMAYANQMGMFGL